MEALMMDLIYDALMLLVAVAVAFAIALLKKKLGTEKMKTINEELMTKRELALMAVRFAEQVYKEFGGPAKYNEASSWLVRQAQDRGLDINDDEIQGLIEATLRQIKDEFGEQWADVIGEEEGQSGGG